MKRTEVTIDAGEIKLLMMALNALPDSALTPAETTTRAAIAYKLGCAVFEVGAYLTHRFAGSDSGRQSVGLPGHCERCAEVGHVKAHPRLGCADVGCEAAHGPEEG